MQKTYLFSVQIGQPVANALISIGYADSVLFLNDTCFMNDRRSNYSINPLFEICQLVAIKHNL
jgi:hypothetical protein